jgi:hypothetical protein
MTTATLTNAAIVEQHRPAPAGDDPHPHHAHHGIDLIDQMKHRLQTPEGHQTYQRRAATVEPVIGHLKDLTGLRRFSRRGLQAVTSELHLAAAATNILKLHRTHTCTT